MYSVDCNPAQSALLELKKVAIQRLPYEDVWKLFGEGRHRDAQRLFDRELSPFLSQSAFSFWAPRLHYFTSGLYYQGGMGLAVWIIQGMFALLGLNRGMRRLVEAPSLEAQVAAWEGLWVVRFLIHAPAWLTAVVVRIATALFFNRVTLWFGAGIPCKQAQLIGKDGVPLGTYAGRVFDGVVRTYRLRDDNYFYHNCITGRYSRDCCPAYLKPANCERLKGGLANLHVRTAFFMDVLRARKYDKVILMDHVDWLNAQDAQVI